MTPKTKALLAIVLGSLILGSTAYYVLSPASPWAKHPGDSQGTNPSGTPIATTEIVAANNHFALDLLSQLSQGSGNVFFSPASISTALAMAYEGARGSTAEEMRTVLHFPADSQTRRAEFAALIDAINGADSNCTLRTANSMWVQQDFRILDEYLNAIRNYYRSNVTSVDYVGAAEQARLTINSWVENQTNGKIKDLIPAGALDSLTRVVLTNAIYFKGDWVQQFNESATSDAKFHAPSQDVSVKLMKRVDGEARFKYASTSDVQALEMPYTGGRTSMLVLLPAASDTAALEKSLTAEKIAGWRGSLKEQQVKLYFPKFKLECKYSLKDTLEKMGMPTAFSGAADFSGVDGKQDLYISQVLHKSYVDVNEKGTEAAAATAVILEGKGIGTVEPPIPVFKADHPFIFLIIDNQSGAVLFLGKLADPSSAQ